MGLGLYRDGVSGSGGGERLKKQKKDPDGTNFLLEGEMLMV